MKLKFSSAVLFSAISISAAASAAIPTCGSETATNAVIEQTKQQITQRNGAATAAMFNYSLRGQRTAKTNSSGAHWCRSNIVMILKSDGRKVVDDPIQYTIEPTESGDVFYTIYGL